AGCDLLQVAQTRQLLERRKSKHLEKSARGRVEHGTAWDLAVARYAHEVSLQQAPKHRPCVHTAHVFDLCAGEGLLVGHDRQGLERRAGEPQRAAWVQRTDVFGEIRTGAQLPSAGHLGDLEAPALLGVLGVEFPDELAHEGGTRVRNELSQTLRGQGLRRCEEKALYDPALLLALHRLSNP